MTIAISTMLASRAILLIAALSGSLRSQATHAPDPNFIDLVSRPTWLKNRIESGKVSDRLNPEMIKNLVIVYSNSTMEIREVAKILHACLRNAGNFVPAPSKIQDPVWQAVVVTKDGKHLLLQVGRDQLYLVGESFSGYFNAANAPSR